MDPGLGTGHSTCGYEAQKCSGEPQVGTSLRSTAGRATIQMDLPSSGGEHELSWGLWQLACSVRLDKAETRKILAVQQLNTCAAV